MNTKKAAILVALTGATISAHDFWLAATQWTPAAGEKVTITAGVGEKFPTRTNFRTRDNWLASWHAPRFPRFSPWEGSDTADGGPVLPSARVDSITAVQASSERAERATMRWSPSSTCRRPPRVRF